MEIQKFDEFNKINEESIFLEVMSGLGVLLNLLKIIASYKINTPGKLDPTLTNEIKEITGHDITIKIMDLPAKTTKEKDKKTPACASANKVFIDKEALKFLTHRELIAVILHESGHVISKHSVKSIILNTFKFIPIILLDSWFLYFVLPLASKIFYLTPFIRNNELIADSFATRYGYGEDLARALIKLTEHYSKYVVTKKATSEIAITIKKLSKFMLSHPKTKDRIKKLYNEENPDDFINRIKAEFKVEEDETLRKEEEERLKEEEDEENRFQALKSNRSSDFQRRLEELSKHPRFKKITRD